MHEQKRVYNRLTLLNNGFHFSHQRNPFKKILLWYWYFVNIALSCPLFLWTVIVFIILGLLCFKTVDINDESNIHFHQKQMKSQPVQGTDFDIKASEQIT